MGLYKFNPIKNAKAGPLFYGPKIYQADKILREKPVVYYICIFSVRIKAPENIPQANNMSLKTSITFVLLLLISIAGNKGAMATDPVFSQFYAAPVYLNPAFAGSTGCSRLAMNYRQLRSVENLHTNNFSLDIYSERLYGGVGIIITNDMNNMVMMRNSIGAMYSYHLQVTSETDLHFGLQASYLRNDIRWNHLEFAVDEPPPNDSNWKHNVDFATGVMLFSDRLYGGFAAHHVNRPDISVYKNVEDDVTSRLEIKYTGHMGMYFKPWQNGVSGGYEYFISPNLIYQSQGDFSHFSAGIYTGAKPVMAGIWFRHHRSSNEDIENINFLAFLAGINMGSYRIGYSYDYSFSGFSDIMHATHELSLAFRFNCPQRNIGGRILNYPSF